MYYIFPLSLYFLWVCSQPPCCIHTRPRNVILTEVHFILFKNVIITVFEFEYQLCILYSLCLRNLVWIYHYFLYRCVCLCISKRSNSACEFVTFPWYRKWLPTQHINNEISFISFYFILFLFLFYFYFILFRHLKLYSNAHIWWLNIKNR